MIVSTFLRLSKRRRRKQTQGEVVIVPYKGDLRLSSDGTVRLMTNNNNIIFGIINNKN